jgi:hypothetical protein
MRVRPFSSSGKKIRAPSVAVAGKVSRKVSPGETRPENVT